MNIPQLLSDLMTIATKHAPQRFGVRDAKFAQLIQTAYGGGTWGASGTLLQSDGSVANWTNYPGHGNVLTLSSKTVASNAITVTIPASTLKAGDVVKISGGAATDGSSTATDVTLTAAGATIADSGSDANTVAHKWCGSATLYYDGTNLITNTSVITDGTTTVAATGASNAQAAASTCAVTVTASNAHATPSALLVEVVRP